MPETSYPRERTALLLVDPYNDFLSEGGKIYPRIKPVADEVGLLDNLRRLDGAIRAAGVQVVIVPHRRWEPGDLIAHEHWAQSGFANTDLDLLLKQKGITHVIVVGLLANTCIESTARFAMELGYHVTLVRDATAALSHEMMHAAHELNGPTFAHAIMTTAEVIAALPEAGGQPTTSARKG